MVLNPLLTGPLFGIFIGQLTLFVWQQGKKGESKAVLLVLRMAVLHTDCG